MMCATMSQNRYYMGIVEIGVIVLFIVAVALAVWWAVVRLRG